MITKQELIRHNDGKGTITLRNTFDFSAEVEAAKQTNSINPGGYFGDKNSRGRVMGYIPEEMWGYDPWLLQAKKARNEGDKGKFTYYMQKFFEVHTVFKVARKTAMWHGSRGVILE